MSKEHQQLCRSIREIEAQVEAEMREFGRRRLEEELQKEADRHGRVFPPQRPGSAARAPTGNAAPKRGRHH